MNRERSCLFTFLKWFLLIFLIIGLIFIITVFVLFLVNYDEVVEEIEKGSYGEKMDIDDKEAFKFITIVIVSLTLLIMLIQIYGIYRESFCIVMLTAIAVLIVLILQIVSLIRNKGSRSVDESIQVGGDVIWFVACAVYAFLIKRENRIADSTVYPYYNPT